MHAATLNNYSYATRNLYPFYILFIVSRLQRYMQQILHRPRNFTRSRHRRLSVRPFGRRVCVIAVGSKKGKKSRTIKSARPCSCARCHSFGRRDHPGDSPFISPFFGGWRFCPPCTRLAYGRPACVGDVLMKQKIEAPSDGPCTE